MRWIIAIAAAMLSAVPLSTRAQSPEQEAYCATLREIVNNTKDDFASLRAKANNNNEWVPKIVLHGQQRCSIQRTAKRTAYVCASVALSEQSRAAEASDENLQRAQACLGKQWKRQETFSEFLTGLNNVEDEQSIIFSIETDSPHPRFLATIQILRMFQQPLEPAPRPAAELAPTDYCAELVKIVRSGKQSFSEIIENARSDKAGIRVHWLSNIQLRGWRDCYVHGDEGKPHCRSMSCSVGPMPFRAEAERLRDKVAAEVKACLGAGWSVGRTRRPDGILGSRIAAGSADAYVEAFPAKSLYSDAWNLDLWVRLDQCK